MYYAEFCDVFVLFRRRPKIVFKWPLKTTRSFIDKRCIYQLCIYREAKFCYLLSFKNNFSLIFLTSIGPKTTKMKSFVVICIIGLAFVRTSHSGIIDILDDRCLTDSSCGSTEYCDRDFPNPFGRCKAGLDSDKACLLDRYCASKQCSFFRCKPRVQVINRSQIESLFYTCYWGIY